MYPASPALLPAAHRLAELRREHDLVAPAVRERGRAASAAAVAAVDVGGVEERDAGVECRVDHPARALLAHPATEVVAAEANNRHVESSEAARAHGREASGTVSPHALLGGLPRGRRDRDRPGQRPPRGDGCLRPALRPTDVPPPRQAAEEAVRQPIAAVGTQRRCSWACSCARSVDSASMGRPASRRSAGRRCAGDRSGARDDRRRQSRRRASRGGCSRRAGSSARTASS